MKIERSVFWKIYFFILVGICLLEIFFSLNSTELRFWEIINIPILIISNIGLYGYVYNKIFYRRKFWVCFVIFIIFWDTVVNFLIGYPSDSDLTELENKNIHIYSFVLSLILLTPCYIGIVLYGSPSNTLWKDYSD